MFQTAAILITNLKPARILESLSSQTSTDRIKIGLIVFSLVVCSGVAGSAIGANLLLDPRKHIKVNTSLFMQAVAPPSEIHTVVIGSGPSTETALAMDSLKLDQITKQNQESIDDRHTIHDELAAIATLEVTHYNLLADRMNVNDARVTTIGWVLGILFTLSQALVLFFHLDKRFQTTRAAEAPRKRVRPQ
jgi:hypothetical protein